MEKKWNKVEIETHIKTNIDDYGGSILVAAFFKKMYGQYPKIGLSGFQAQAIDSIVAVLPDCGDCFTDE